MNEEVVLENLRKHVEDTVESGRKILYQIDSELDKMEGKDVYKATLKIQELLLEWNLLGHNFAYVGLQDWIEPGKTEKEE